MSFIKESYLTAQSPKGAGPKGADPYGAGPYGAGPYGATPEGRRPGERKGARPERRRLGPAPLRLSGVALFGSAPVGVVGP